MCGWGMWAIVSGCQQVQVRAGTSYFLQGEDQRSTGRCREGGMWDQTLSGGANAGLDKASITISTLIHLCILPPPKRNAHAHTSVSEHVTG